MVNVDRTQLDSLMEQGLRLMRDRRLAEAKTVFSEICAREPDNKDAWYHLSSINGELGQLDDAAACCRKVIELQPDFDMAHYNLGNVLASQCKFDEAQSSYREALRLNPSNIYALCNLGNLYTRQCKLDEALTTYREALRLDPHNAVIPAIHSNLLFMMCYDEKFDMDTLFAEHVRWGEMYGRAPSTIMPHDNTPDPNKRLHIGYISGDFRNHPIGIFIEQVLTHHDKSRVEIFCYNNNPDINDDLTERLRSYTDHWRDIAGQTDEAVAGRIRGDGIDILVDLAGHSARNRLLTLALKPAPVQATWIGYIATTGLKAVDYIIADPLVIPPEDERYYVERVMRLPRTFLCFNPPRFPIEVGPLPALVKPQLTFGCFNNNSKVTPGVVAVWAKLLHAVPHARLYLKSANFGDETVRGHYRELFASHGVPAERLTFAGFSSRAEYLAAYNEVDICLDPFPYNGGTTTAEALWMGVPVISLHGDRFVSRMCDSILSAVGLNKECLADSIDQYIAKAVALANDLPHLAELHSGLRERLLDSPLCDGPGFTLELEAAYRTMWLNWCHEQAA